MLELKKGDDILAVVGGISTIDEAKDVIAEKLDGENRKKLSPIKNEEALIKIANAISMCTPDSVFINSGSAADVQWIREYSLEKGEEKKLAKEKKLKIIRAPADTRYATLARKSALSNYPEEQLRLLNDQYPRGEPKPSQLLKVVR